MMDEVKDENGVTIIEDTGESLEDFEYTEENCEDQPSPGGGDSQDGSEGAVPSVESELEEIKEKYLRTLAELDNFKKRSVKEREEQVRYAMSSFFSEFLPIVDNHHRAITTGGGDLESLREGVTMILKQIDQLLDKFGIKEIEVRTGDPFDPLYQEAVSSELSEEVSEPTIGDIFQKGYLLKNRLLRPVLVTVRMPDNKQKGEPNGESSGN